MTLADARRDRTELRLRLFDNGFTPLPNSHKMCFLEGWSRVEVTRAMIESRDWARRRSWSDTGIRTGDVIAIDLDINDKTLLDELADAIVGQGLLPESEFVRIGRAPREMWLYRTHDRIGKRTTGGFVHPDSEADSKPEQVEVLGTGSLFGAYGFHSDGIEYTWPVKSLLDHKYMELPEINLQQVEALRSFCETFFTDHGLERRSPHGSTDGGYTRVYDLTPDMVFPVKDVGPMTVAQLDTYLRETPDSVLRCTVEAIRSTTGGSLAGMASYVAGSVCISDHGTYMAHFPIEVGDDSAFTRLGTLLAERYPEPAPPAPDDLDDLPEMNPRALLDTNLVIALRQFALVKSEDSKVCDLRSPNFSMHTMRSFQHLTADYLTMQPGPRGGEKITLLSDLWQRHPDRIKVEGLMLRPDEPRPIFFDKAVAYINTYRPPAHPRGGRSDLGERLVEYLLPRVEERAWFMQWLAYKFRHPGVPGPAVIMVAPDSYGTGRGSLINLVIDLFGDRYVRRIDFNTLTGRNSQAQYNEWQTESLIVAVDEAKETTQGIGSWQTRSNAYEHLKNVIDPAPRYVHVNRKGLKNGQTWTTASIMVMTNHSDALVIPAGDRRLGVLTNGAPAPTEFWHRFNSWRIDPRNIGAFADRLLNVDLAGYDAFMAPPMTTAKADMIYAGASDLDRAMLCVIEALPGAALVKEQVIIHLEAYLVENSAEFREGWQETVGRMLLRLTDRHPAQDRIRINGRTYPLRLKRGTDTTEMLTVDITLEQVMLNGPLSRGFAGSGVDRGNVVSFDPSRPRGAA